MIQTFFKLIPDELGRAEQLLTERARVERLFERTSSPVPLEEGVRRGLKLLVVPQAVELALELGGTPPGVPGAEDVALMTLCLVRNALEALPAGGKAVVRTSAAPDGGVRLEVRDSGPGMSADERSRALRPFVTAKPGQRGLGLNIARRLALKLGATLTLDNGVDGGLVAGVAFPAGQGA